MTKMVACALVGSRLDFANSVLYDTAQKKTSRNFRAHRTSLRVMTLLFPFIVKYQSASHPICPHFIWRPQFQHCSYHNLEFSHKNNGSDIFLTSCFHTTAVWCKHHCATLIGESNSRNNCVDSCNHILLDDKHQQVHIHAYRGRSLLFTVALFFVWNVS